MSRPGHAQQVRAGEQFPHLELTGLDGELISLPHDTATVHLQFRRFAGCPICNLHLRSISTRLGELESHGVREVVVFHSTQAELRRYENELPMAVVADPERRLYQRFGVEASPRTMLSPGLWRVMPRVWWQVLRRLAAGRAPFPVKPTGGQLGLPADILIAPDGRVLAVKYGTHAYDQWSVDEIVERVAAADLPANPGQRTSSARFTATPERSRSR